MTAWLRDGHCWWKAKGPRKTVLRLAHCVDGWAAYHQILTWLDARSGTGATAREAIDALADRADAQYTEWIRSMPEPEVR